MRAVDYDVIVVTIGKIMKAGNSRLRQTFVEGNASISLRAGRRRTLPAIRTLSPEVKTLANKGNTRLLNRYEHLISDNGMRACKDRMAIASEQVRWIWIIGLTAQCELERVTV